MRVRFGSGLHRCRPSPSHPSHIHPRQDPRWSHRRRTRPAPRTSEPPTNTLQRSLCFKQAATTPPPEASPIFFPPIRAQRNPKTLPISRLLPSRAPVDLTPRRSQPSNISPHIPILFTEKMLQFSLHVPLAIAAIAPKRVRSWRRGSAIRPTVRPLRRSVPAQRIEFGPRVSRANATVIGGMFGA